MANDVRLFDILITLERNKNIKDMYILFLSISDLFMYICYYNVYMKFARNGLIIKDQC